MDVDGVVAGLSQPVGRLVVVVLPPGAGSKQRKSVVEVHLAVPVRVAAVVVEEDGRAVDEARVGGHIGSVTHVDVHQARLGFEVPRVVQLLVDEAVEKGAVEGHVVSVKQRRPVGVDDRAQQHVVAGFLGHRVISKLEVLGSLGATVLPSDAVELVVDDVKSVRTHPFKRCLQPMGNKEQGP